MASDSSYLVTFCSSEWDRRDDCIRTMHVRWWNYGGNWTQGAGSPKLCRFCLKRKTRNKVSVNHGPRLPMCGFCFRARKARYDQAPEDPKAEDHLFGDYW